VGTLVEGGPLANFKSTQESIVLQPVLLTLSAMLSQDFTRCSMRGYDSAGNVIEAHSTRAILDDRDGETKDCHALEAPITDSSSERPSAFHPLAQ
jgi:hypothetical protein